MTVKLNKRAAEHAEHLVQEGKVVVDDRDAWSEHRPSADEENAYLEQHGWEEYGRWYLGVDDEHAEDTKGHYKFPYSDFSKVHRCGLLAAESRAGQNDYDDIEKEAHRLHTRMEPATQSS